MKDNTELADAIRVLAGRVTELTELTRGNLVNHVLFSGTLTIPATGYATLDFAVPMASVGAQASATFGYVTLASSPPATAVPVDGAGVVVVGPDAMLCVPMTGRILTIYGAAGDRVWVGVWSRPQPPAGA